MNYLPKWVLEKTKPEPRAVPKEEQGALAVMWDGNCKYVLKTQEEIELFARKPKKIKMDNGIVFLSKWYSKPKWKNVSKT